MFVRGAVDVREKSHYEMMLAEPNLMECYHIKVRSVAVLLLVS